MKRGVFNILGLNKRTFSGNYVPILAILLLATITVTPLLYVAKYLMILWSMFFVLFTGSVFNKSDVKLRKLFFLGLSFITITIIYRVVGVSSASLAHCMGRPFVYFAPIAGLIFLDRCDNENQIRFLFHFISLVTALNIADSIRITQIMGIENLVYQNLLGGLEDQGLKGLNLGGSLFVNMVVFYADIMFLAFMKSKNRLERILFLLYFVIGTYFIIMCSLKASAVVLLLVSIVLMFIANKGGKNFGRIFVITAFFGAIAIIFRDQLINLIISFIGSDRITARLEVFLSTNRVTDSTTLMGRDYLWELSLHSWLRNPFTFLFGVGDHYWADTGSYELGGIGDHSDLLDVLARYGIIGGVLLYSSLIVFYKFLQKRYGATDRWAIISFFILIVLMGLTKKFVSGEPAIIIFILLPLCLKTFHTNKLNSYKDGNRAE